MQFNEFTMPAKSPFPLESDAFLEPRERTRNLLKEALENPFTFRIAFKEEEVSKVKEVKKVKEVCKRQEVNESEEVHKGEVKKVKEVCKREEVNESEEVSKGEEVEKVKEVCKRKEVNESEEVSKVEELKKVKEVYKPEEVNELEEVNKGEEISKGEITKEEEVTKRGEENKGEEVTKEEETSKQEEVNSPLVQLEVLKEQGSSTPVDISMTTKPLTKKEKRRLRKLNKMLSTTKADVLLNAPEALASLEVKNTGPSQGSGLESKPFCSLSTPFENRKRNRKPYCPYPASNHPAMGSLEITIMPEDYPTTLLTTKQGKEIRDHLTSELDRLNVDGEWHPEFSGHRFKSGVIFLTCDNEASKTWLVECVDNLSLKTGGKLRIGSLQDVNKIIKVGALFPGNRIANNLLLKRLRVQNPNVIDISKWTIIGGKEEAKGFYGILKIPETSFKYLAGQNFLMSYGLSKVSLQCLGNKKLPKKRFNQKEGVGKIVQRCSVSRIPGEKCNATKSSNALSDYRMTYSDMMGAKALKCSSKISAWELAIHDTLVKTRPERKTAWEAVNHNEPAMKRAGRYESDGHNEPAMKRAGRYESGGHNDHARTRLEIPGEWKQSDYNRPVRGRLETEVIWESSNYGGSAEKKRPKFAGGLVSPNDDQPAVAMQETKSKWQLAKNGRRDKTKSEKVGVWETGNYSMPARARSISGNELEFSGGNRYRPENSDTWMGGKLIEPVEVVNHDEPTRKRARRYETSSHNCYARTRLETASAWDSSNYGRTPRKRPEKADEWESGDHCRLARELSEAAVEWESGSYSKPAYIRAERARERETGNHDWHAKTISEVADTWDSGHNGGPAKKRAERWDPGSYGELPQIRPQRSGEWKTGTHDRPDRIRPENFSELELTNARPVSSRHGRDGWQEASLIESDEITPIRFKSWELSYHMSKTRSDSADSLESSYDESARTGYKSKSSLVGSNDIEPVRTRLEPVSALESDSYGGCAGNRPEVEARWESGIQDSHTRTIFEAAVTCDSVSHGGPARTKSERVVGCEQGNHDKPVRKIPKRARRFKSGRLDGHAKTRPGRSGRGGPTIDDVPARVRTEKAAAGESACCSVPACNGSERVDVC